MHIRNVTVENVKSFRKKTRFNLGSGVNYFVGDNNSGKSTVMESLLFLFEGPSAQRGRPESFYSTEPTGPTRVEVDIAGGVESLVAQQKYKVLEKYVFDDRGEKILRLERSSEPRQVLQGTKSKNIDVKAVCFWNPENKQFENVTGIDAKVKSIFDFEAIWADAQPGDHIDFASTKTLGRLLDTSFKSFALTDRWRALEEAHESAFSSEEEDSFFVETKRLAEKIQGLVGQQYGNAALRFEFGLPDASIFMKQGRLHVDDGAGETPIEGKGTGMQRAIALSIIQLYARSAALTEDENQTPLLLMLDEPETWLHPSAQLRLGDALSSIGEHEQVFVITHSPYLIRKFEPSGHKLTVLSGQGSDRRIDDSEKFGLFGIGEPTWGEINYRAFDICSHEFHNELFGFVQKFIEASKTPGRVAGEAEIDEFLSQRNIPRDTTWIRTSGRTDPRTICLFVRNSIHHPENRLNNQVTDEDLRKSTEALVTVVENLPPTP